MTNEKSLQVAQGLSILSLLVASGRLDPGEFAHAYDSDILHKHLMATALDMSDEDRARLLGAIEMVSP